MTIDALPRWDTTILYPSPADRGVTAALEEMAAEAGRLVALYDRHGVGRMPPHDPTAHEVAAFDEVLTATNELDERLGTLDAYLRAARQPRRRA